MPEMVQIMQLALLLALESAVAQAHSYMHQTQTRNTLVHSCIHTGPEVAMQVFPENHSHAFRPAVSLVTHHQEAPPPHRQAFPETETHAAQLAARRCAQADSSALGSRPCQMSPEAALHAFA